MKGVQLHIHRFDSQYNNLFKCNLVLNDYLIKKEAVKKYITNNKA